MKQITDKTHLIPTISIIVLVILYTVGTYAFLMNWTEVILLTPVNLLISLFLLLFASRLALGIRFLIYIVLAYIAGYSIELLGTQTGFPFGAYTYHHVLGYKLWDTPLLIGVNWLLLLLATRAVIDRFLNVTIWQGAIIGAFLMVALDILIEPVAVQFDFWTWDLNSIPLSNYISWWVIAFILHLLQRFLILKYNNPVAISLFIIQLLFFGILNIFT